ncbi:ABC transporter substrate-binding protein [Zavarzinia compransoris]|uniref:ABC transporter substrate-binding protein n=1 Tax=Zavarzinia marina TaxID=2911065 RepID=UPI001F21AA19|nr:ABC transporter substrate-binding protein [Zavarzinia marina]MCF4164707.1 ABC transporter substrate-binding protein [Zavarzinia marina]
MFRTKALLFGGAVLMAGSLASQARAEEISISCGALGIELQLCQDGVTRWSEKTGHTVKVVSTPNSATERLALYQQILAAGAGDIDVLQVDVIWPGILGEHLIDLSPYAGDAPKAHFQAIVDNNTVDGELKAMPWFTDAGVLFYRKDLLAKYGRAAPSTWAEMAETARIVQDGERAAGGDGLWGYVFQGRVYEGLTCNGLEWLDSYGAGTIVDAEGEVTVDNPAAVAALTEAAGWIGTISPQGVLNYTEEEARGVFQSGNAVFMRNWPYAWALAQSDDSPVKDKVGVVALPMGGEAGHHTGTLGGWNLAVSKYSAHPEIAADLVMFLTSAEEQKRRAIEGSYNPTVAALYEDAEVLAAVPFFGDLYDTFTNAVARPSRATGAKYNRVSAAFAETVHEVLNGKAEAAPALAELADTLAGLKRRGW